MKSIAQQRRKWKVKVAAKREGLEDRMNLLDIDDVDARASVIQSLIPIGLAEVNVTV